MGCSPKRPPCVPGASLDRRGSLLVVSAITVWTRAARLKVSRMTNIPSGVAAANDAAPQSAVYPSLAGKRVVVTGGGSGIGAGLVEAFARQGAETIFVDILEKESEALVARLAGTPIQTVFHRLDLTDLAAMEGFFQSLGDIDVLVNNAGNDDRHSLADITPAYWDERLAVNLRHMLFA